MGNKHSTSNSDISSVSSKASRAGGSFRRGERLGSQWSKKKTKKKKYRESSEERQDESSPSYVSASDGTESTDAFTRPEEVPVTRSIAPQEPSCSKEDTKEDSVLKTVQAKLKEQYLKFEMKSLPWMRENSAPTLQDYYVDLAMKKSGRKQNVSEEMKIEDIFSSTNSTRNLRILIEGETGSGKTTLATKLAYDWARGKKYVSHFGLVLLLPLRLFLDNLDDTLAKASCVKEEDKALFVKLAKEEALPMLLILDGYDETSSINEAEILPLINKDRYPKSTIIITSKPGNFTNKYTGAGTRTFRHMLDKRVTIKGFSESQQKKFIEKHIELFSKSQKAKIRLKFDKMEDKEVLSYPLFLLMLIVLFSSEKQEEYLETKTELYKRIFTFVIKRYFAKSRKEPVDDVDLFSCKLGEKLPHIKLMNQFSAFALRVLNKGNQSFSKKELMETYECNPEILELGFLKQCVSIKGFSECVLYEPVHKSLLEFAAAYGLHLFYEEKRCFPSIQDIITNRPTDTSSLFFPFLVGLMGQNSGVLFNILHSYAFEYSWKFGQLHQSLLETSLTALVLQPLTPFLPQAWNIHFCHKHGDSSKHQTSESKFLMSSQHEAAVRWGVLRSKIFVVNWDVLQDTHLPTNVLMDNLVLNMQDVKNVSDLTTIITNSAQYKSCTHSQNKLHCKYLWCSFSNSVYETKMSFDDFFELLQKFIDFQLISFDLSHSYKKNKDDAQAAQMHDQEPLMHISNAAINGKLKRTQMHCVSTDKLTSMNLFNDLISADRIEVLELRVENTTQEEIDTFITYAAESINLRNVVLSTDLPTEEIEKLPFTVNLAGLCNEGQKSWKSVKLFGVKVACTVNVSFLIFQHLEITSCNVTPDTKLMLRCQAQSLYCQASLLAHTWPQWPCQDSLTELNINVDAALLYRGLFSVTDKLRNLQILALTMTPFKNYAFSLPVEEWIGNVISCRNLKGFEIWSFNRNSRLATELLAGLIKYLENQPLPSESQYELGASKPVSSATETLYLAVNDIEKESGQQAVTYLPRLKTCLKQKRLTRLEMVFTTEPRVLDNRQEDSLFSKYSIKQAFHHEEGFVVEHDLCGSKDDDSIYSKRMHLQSIKQKGRISITFKQKPNSVNGAASIRF